MSLRLIVSFLFFALLSTYLAFLNPEEVEIHLTQSIAFRLPMVVLVVGFILAGVIITVFFNWAIKVKSSFRGLKTSLASRHQTNKLKRLDDLFQKGENALSGGNLEKASAMFEKILDESPDHLDALFTLGKVKGQEGNLSRALELHKKAAKLSPDNIKVLYGLAQNYNQAGLPEKEVEVLDKIRRFDPRSPIPLIKMRDSYERVEDWSNACAVQKKIIPLINKKEEKEREQQRFSHLICNQGMRHHEKGNYDAAISEFKHAIRTDSHCLPAYISLGDTYHLAGNQKSAVKTWKTGFLNTRSPLCLLRMQKISAEAGHLKEIKSIYREAIGSSKNSEKETLVMLMGKLLIDAGETEEAVKTLESIQPKGSVLHSVLLANAYEAAKDNSLWEKTFRSAFSKAKESILQFRCGECQTPVREWTGHCPVCNAWNRVSCRPREGSPPRDN